MTTAAPNTLFYAVRLASTHPRDGAASCTICACVPPNGPTPPLWAPCPYARVSPESAWYFLAPKFPPLTAGEATTSHTLPRHLWSRGARRNAARLSARARTRTVCDASGRLRLEGTVLG